MTFRRKKTKTAILGMLCSATFTGGACFPEDYAANLFQSITTNGANIVLQSIIATALDAAGFLNPLVGANTVIVDGMAAPVGG